MSALVDMTGQTCARLTVIEFAGTNEKRHALWRCLCDCGQEVIAAGYALRSGNTKSCGCFKKQVTSERHFKHGHSPKPKLGKPQSATYSSWQAMRQRCLNPNTIKYYRYGGAGVTVCHRWRESFENFLADLGERPAGTTLGRFGDTGNYEPGNVKWMTPAEQRANWRPDRNLGICKSKAIVESMGA